MRVVGGWVDGWTVDSLGPSIFLNFKYVKNYVMKLLNIYKKLSRQISCGFKILVKLGSCSIDFQNYTVTPTFFKNGSQLHRDSVFLRTNFRVNFFFHSE